MTLPNDCRLVVCDSKRAQECLDMCKAILADVAATNPSWYLIDETDDEYRALFSNPECFALGIEAPDGTLAGCGAASYRAEELERFRPYVPAEDFAVPGRVGYVEFIQVALGCRGCGFQRVLFQELEKILVDRGAKYLTSVVSPDNKYSLANFHKEGYREVGRYVHQRTGYPRLIMIKNV
ncbi:MAG: GNAT family N-acetyltransferase [Thermoguttaceae bacterium]|nr:GNAT family N-acetyltransferase [Thermoguttaceae bacterium]